MNFHFFPTERSGEEFKEQKKALPRRKKKNMKKKKKRKRTKGREGQPKKIKISTKMEGEGREREKGTIINVDLIQFRRSECGRGRGTIIKEYLN